MPPESRPAPARHAGAVILVAGQSTRMGTPKTLLPFGGVPLVRHVAQTVLDAGYESVIVVASRPAEVVERALTGLPVRVVTNDRAAEGIGTSIAAGILALDSAVTHAALVLADQPFVRAEHLARLRDDAEHYAVVASRYEDTVGVPAVFARDVFSRLQTLAPDEGCKGVIRALAEHARFIDCPEAAVDVDTPADYARAQERAATSPS